MTLPRALVVAGLLSASALGLMLLPRSMTSHRSADVAANPRPKRAAPTLYCDFYNVTHNATVVSFYFAVERQDRAEPKFSELFVVEPDGAKTDFDGSGDTAVPQWTYLLEDGTPTITSPDAATQIVLYGLKREARGTIWTEAGLRSNDYRNLDGKCRQAGFDDKTDQGGTP